MNADANIPWLAIIPAATGLLGWLAYLTAAVLIVRMTGDAASLGRLGRATRGIFRPWTQRDSSAPCPKQD